MDYLDPAAPTCPHLHPHLYTYTHTHTHTYTCTHLNTLLACEPQVTTMYTNSKEAAWLDNVSKQLQYDENSEDMGRLVKGSKKEKKKTVQKMSKHND